jgi:putative salt-induced outer membrane protein YdiY
MTSRRVPYLVGTLFSLLLAIQPSARVAAQSGSDAAPAAAAPAPLTLSAPDVAPPPAAAESMSEKLSAPGAAPQDITSLNLSAGGAMATGNTGSYLILAGGDFRLVRQPHALTINAAFAYGEARTVPNDNESPLEPTVRNINAKAKYDLFLDQMDALFIATGFRWDPFAGLAHRNSGQIGYGRYFIAEAKHRFWVEVGYDLTGTKYMQVPNKPAPDKSSDIVHSARAFLGYENQLNEAVTYLGGIEGLIDVEKPGASRLNWDNALRSTLSNAFKLELRFRLAYDAQPVSNAKKLDTATAISLLYSLI